MMKKVLFVATVTSHINAFHLPYLELFKKNGWKTYVATGDKTPVKDFCDEKITILISRSPYSLNNLKAIKQLRTILEKEHFDIIHCHTPMGSVVARLAAKNARKAGTRVIYTAHGFHFYKGASILNWIIFYPIEKYLAKFTDTLITINHEDYSRAKKKFSKHCRDIQYVPGVGIDPKKFDFKMTAKEKHELRASLGLKDDDFVMIFPARLNKDKNQDFLIKCMPELISKNPKMHVLLPGPDETHGNFEKVAKKLNVEKHVHFLGRRDDIPKLLKISNLGISTSKREGFGINLIESLESGTPVIARINRGHIDILSNNKMCLFDNKEDMIKLIEFNSIRPSHNIQKYHVSNIIPNMRRIYNINSSEKKK